MKHRGRIQIQGENIEASESWSQIEPPTKTDGLNLLNKFKNGKDYGNTFIQTIS